MTSANCRFCGTQLDLPFLDLGMSPLSNAFLKQNTLNQGEMFYPLKVHVCRECKLVQLQEFEAPNKIFEDYVYFSSYSTSWLAHAKQYVNMVIQKFSLNSKSLVVEIASNDGYLLQYFKEENIPAIGFEPAENVAEVAIEKGIETRVQFFGEKTASEFVNKKGKVDLILGNNVLAHVPNLNDFVTGIKVMLKSDGVGTLEFPHLLKLLELSQFDTIYHEHFSYFSLFTLLKVFKKHNLKIYDVEELETHGGSLRLYVCHSENSKFSINKNVDKILIDEVAYGIPEIGVYNTFGYKVLKIKQAILEFLFRVKDEGKIIVGYGAPAKGNTFLNYCGILNDLIPFTVDKNPHKQNSYLPGTHIPVQSPDRISELKPHYVFILPWNLKTEISGQLHYIREWGGQFVTAIPSLEVNK